MKNIMCIFVLLMVFQYCAGQDRITLKNDQQQNVLIVEKTNKILKYKMADYDDGPVLWLNLNRIQKIEYKNGITDLMGYQNPRKSRPLTLSLGGAFAPVGRSGFVSANIDYFIIPQVELEMNVGTSDIRTYGGLFAAGGKIHFNFRESEKKLTIFSGLLAGSNYGDEFIQIPGGVNYIYNSRINASFSVNEMIGFDSWYVTFFEVKAGWRFKL